MERCYKSGGNLMPKRDFRNSNLFNDRDDDEETAAGSWLDAHSQIYGQIQAREAQIERLKRISIFEIAPDFAQPRRAIPSSIRQMWDQTSQGVGNLLRLWQQAAQKERGDVFNLGAYLSGTESERTESETSRYNPGPIEESLMKIVMLAASIRRDGLTNPITVVPIQEGKYQLETGERRWLAHHLLYIWFNGEDGKPDERDKWEKIIARQVDKVDVWRQATENNARTDLNAISRARQYAVLMMNLHGQENFAAFDAFSNEQDYYAQALKKKSAPYGKGEDLLNAMGVKSRSALSRYRLILSLPNEIWVGGDDLNLPEELLAKLASMPSKEAIAYYRENVLGQNNSPKAKPSLPEQSPGTKRHFLDMVRAIKRAGHGQDKYNTQALKALRELRDWLDEQEKRISSYLD
ncbi:MAG: hypothetical protein D6711_00385 [Chloroflexi bacterium]|nr:MAG: hypothetical protein D6711_00385 [Chloroflexota bacterium]